MLCRAALCISGEALGEVVRGDGHFTLCYLPKHVTTDTANAARDATVFSRWPFTPRPTGGIGDSIGRTIKHNHNIRKHPATNHEPAGMSNDDGNQ